MAPVPWLPGAFAGVDRYSPPTAEWMEKLLHLSSFSWCLHYLTHYWGGPSDARAAKGKTVETWKKIFPRLMQQGWGVMFCYVAVSQRTQIDKKTGKPDNTSWESLKGDWKRPIEDRILEAAELGVKHAKLLKEFVVPLGHEAQGAIVYVDNEDFPMQEREKLRPEVVAYYNALFDEMRQLGTEGLALRPAIYARPQPLTALIASVRDNTDLFLYECDEDWDYTHRSEVPFEQRAGRIQSPIEKHPLRGTTYLDYDGKVQRTALLLGRQWRFYKERLMPTDRSKVRGLSPQSDWDFDASMVRDPRYPIAMPRIVISDDIRLRSSLHVPVLDNQRVRLPVTQLEQVHSDWPIKLPYGTMKSEMLEHEAPLILLGPAAQELRSSSSSSESIVIPGADPEVISLNQEGQPIIVTGATGSNPSSTIKWSSSAMIFPSEALLLRRNRALTATKASGPDSLTTQLFFVSSDHKLMVSRRTNLKSWTTPVVLGGDELVHQFSNIAATVRQQRKEPITDTTHVFYLDIEGRPCVASYSTNISDSSEPDIDIGVLQPKPTLLRGTSMAAISPSPDDTLLFAIGIDCHLHMSKYNTSTGWSPMSKIPGGNIKPDDDRLFPHTKIDAFVDSPTSVYVAAVTATNVPCTYVLLKSSSGWYLRERLYHHNRPDVQVVVDPRATFEAAPGLPDDYNDKILLKSVKKTNADGSKEVVDRDVNIGYAFNPFGDVKLSKVGADLVIWIAGVTMTATAGVSGDRGVVLFRMVLVSDRQGEVWKRVK
ncbi:hypothetical protein EJ04DRAFT_523612 [Polyplosphaeria fusca]|uniref:Uncharacterized protein n=1 Tax=Polyplosphaeria fusca TaxID=682080 RepID=A0A9P4R0D2_9PLEO|nr:hypothetical protein EJ04DRAFT_523612 [Polyplosphaeria fusca]